MHPYQDSAAAKLIAQRVLDLSYRKTQRQIAAEAGFPNPNMLTHLKQGRNKVPLVRVPALARALEVDPALLMRLALDQALGRTAAKAIIDVLGTPVTANEAEWLAEIRSASDNTDPPLNARARAALRALLQK